MHQHGILPQYTKNENGGPVFDTHAPEANRIRNHISRRLVVVPGGLSIGSWGVMEDSGNIWGNKSLSSKLGRGTKRLAAVYIFGILACIFAGVFVAKRREDGARHTSR